MALVLGIDYQSFLNLTPSTLNNTRKKKVDYDNMMLYIQGAYNYNAFAAVIGSAFSKKNYPYLDKPIKLTEDDIDDIKQKHYENKAKFEAMVHLYNRKFEGNNE